jgi:hypothetical protein
MGEIILHIVFYQLPFPLPDQVIHVLFPLLYVERCIKGMITRIDWLRYGYLYFLWGELLFKPRNTNFPVSIRNQDVVDRFCGLLMESMPTLVKRYLPEKFLLTWVLSGNQLGKPYPPHLLYRKFLEDFVRRK